MLEIIIIIILLIYSIVVSIGMIKGMKKTEMYETEFNIIRNKINQAYSDMKEIDTLGAFEADDDVGAVFTEMKNITEELNAYVVENIRGENNA